MIINNVYTNSAAINPAYSPWLLQKTNIIWMAKTMKGIYDIYYEHSKIIVKFLKSFGQ